VNKILVTGASGFLGWNVCCAARASCDVYGVYYSHQLTIDNVTMVRTNMTDEHEMRSMFERIRPDAVIHCAAIADPNTCERDPALSHCVNVEASVRLARMCKETGAAMVFVSTDLVFDGEHAPYAETDATTPVSVYGRHKLEAENSIREIYADVTVCRVPVMFGDPCPCSKSFIQPLIANLTQNKEITLFTDEYRSPVSGKTAAQALLCALLHRGETFHCGGRQRISRFDFGLLLCKAIGVDESLIKPVLQKDVVSAAKRPRDVSLVSDKIYALGYDPAGLEDQLAELLCVKDLDL